MTLPTKGSRPINVGGRAYRWTIRDRPTYPQAVAMASLTLAIECVEHPQCTLHLRLSAPRLDNVMLLPGYVVTPSDVARWILKALERGWDPAAAGPSFKLELSDSDMDPKHFAHPGDR